MFPFDDVIIHNVTTQTVAIAVIVLTAVDRWSYLCKQKCDQGQRTVSTEIPDWYFEMCDQEYRVRPTTTHTHTDDSNNNKTNNIDTNAQNVSINIDDS